MMMMIDDDLEVFRIAFDKIASEFGTEAVDRPRLRHKKVERPIGSEEIDETLIDGAGLEGLITGLVSIAVVVHRRPLHSEEHLTYKEQPGADRRRDSARKQHAHRQVD